MGKVMGQEFDPAVSVRPQTQLIALLRPTIELTLWSHNLAGNATLFLFLRTYFLASLAATAFLSSAIRLATVSSTASRTLLAVSERARRGAWNSKAVKRLRRKIVFEFVTLALGPSGNTLFLAMFWPGWWFLGGVAWVAWLRSG